MQDAAQELAIAEQEGDKAGAKVQAEVEKEDGDFDPDNAEADEGEPIGDDEADDAGKIVILSLLLSNYPIACFTETRYHM